ncbi:NlpC/P60 family protein [Ponticaulis profundi]|uniref:NlpC/P60 family protein n=1 Tax=Ponticaulis profundi TaxID=2665222 RepID=A0ABW1S4T7_9PROT
MILQEQILREARSWIGTPYRHQASVKGAGTDCLGLVRGIWRAVYQAEPEAPPPYTPDWAEALGQDTLLEAARRHMTEQAIGDARSGDLILFRMGLGTPAKHAAIMSGQDTIIHAYWGRSVCETRLVPWWRRRIAAVFEFPDISHED